MFILMFFPPVDKQKIFYFFEKTKIPKKSILIVRKFPCVERSKKNQRNFNAQKKFGSRSIMFQISQFIFEFAIDAKQVFARIIIAAIKK